MLLKVDLEEMQRILPRIRYYPLRTKLVDFLFVSDRERRQYTGDDIAKYLADVLLVARDVQHDGYFSDDTDGLNEGGEVLNCLTMVE